MHPEYHRHSAWIKRSLWELMRFGELVLSLNYSTFYWSSNQMQLTWNDLMTTDNENEADSKAKMLNAWHPKRNESHATDKYVITRHLTCIKCMHVWYTYNLIHFRISKQLEISMRIIAHRNFFLSLVGLDFNGSTLTICGEVCAYACGSVKVTR